MSCHDGLFRFTNELVPQQLSPVRYQHRTLIKKRRLLPRSLRRMDYARCFHAPESAEEIDRPRTEPRVVVIGKCQNHDAPLLDLLEKTDPLGKITLAINNHLVPSCRFFLNPFTVPQPSNVSEIRGN